MLNDMGTPNSLLYIYSSDYSGIRENLKNTGYFLFFDNGFYRGTADKDIQDYVEHFLL